MTDEQAAKIIETMGRLDERTLQMQLLLMGDDGEGGLKGRVDDLVASKNRLWGFGAAGVALSGLVEYFIHRK